MSFSQQQYYAAGRAKTARQKVKMAELVSQGWTITAVARELGISQQRASTIWKSIKDDLIADGWSGL